MRKLNKQQLAKAIRPIPGDGLDWARMEGFRPSGSALALRLPKGRTIAAQHGHLGKRERLAVQLVGPHGQISDMYLSREGLDAIEVLCRFAFDQKKPIKIISKKLAPGKQCVSGQSSDLRMAISTLKRGKSFPYPNNNMPYKISYELGIPISVKKDSGRGYLVGLRT